MLLKNLPRPGIYGKLITETRRRDGRFDFFAWTLDDAIMAGDEAHDAEVRASA